MTEMVKKQYNYCMDFLKGIACIFVVFIHVKFPGDFGQAVQAVARFAVPFFFMVSGYYCYRKDYQGVKGGGKKIWHILKITFFACLFYIVVALLENQLLGAGNTFNFHPKHVLEVVLFTVPENVPGQLWFLIALLEVYLLYFIIDYFKIRKVAYVWAILMFLTLIALSQGAWLCGISINPSFYRNGLVEGFAFFMLGYFLHDKKNCLTVSNKVLITVIIISAALSVVERFLCGRVFGVHLSTYPLVSSLFIYAINNCERHEGVVQRVGKKYSMYVYILHIFFWHELDRVFEVMQLNESDIVIWLRPLIVLSLTLLASMGCYALFNRTKKEQILPVNIK